MTEGDLVDALRSNGVRIDYLKSQGCLPIRIFCGGFRGGQVSATTRLAPHVIDSLAVDVDVDGRFWCRRAPAVSSCLRCCSGTVIVIIPVCSFTSPRLLAGSAPYAQREVTVKLDVKQGQGLLLVFMTCSHTMLACACSLALMCLQLSRSRTLT